MANYKEPKTISVDFDLTLCQSNYPDLGPVIPGAKEALTILKSLGYRIIISSCRSCGWNWEEYYPGTSFVPATERPVYKAMVDWLKVNDIPYDIIDDGTKGKVSASYFVDDKAIRFENNWDQIVFAIHQKEMADKQQALQAAQAPQANIAQR